MELLQDTAGRPVVEPYRSCIELVRGRLLGFEGASAALVTGSVAYGCADEYADLDFLVLCDSVPAERERREAYDGFGPPLGVATEAPADGSAELDEFDIHHERGRTAVFLWLRSAESARGMVARVAGLEAPSEGDLLAASSLQEGLVLFDRSGLFEALRDRVDPMPPAVRRSLVAGAVARMTVCVPLHGAKLGALRGDVLAARLHLGSLARATAHAVLALNACYYCGNKHLEARLGRCAVAPDDCGGRLADAVSKSNPTEAFHAWLDVAREAFRSVSGLLPAEQYEEARHTLDWIGPWDGRP